MTTASSHRQDRLTSRVTVAVMTRNRVAELLGVLDRLVRLPEAPSIMVVDNGSSDGTSQAVMSRFPSIDVVRFRRNLGVEARNCAVRLATTPYVAFNDDDSWWAPGSLVEAASLFDRHPRLGAIAAHVRVEPGGNDDPVSVEMEASPLTGTADVPGTPVLGFLACAVALRREAFLQVGGFERRFHFGGEEQLLATDLAAAGWELRYQPHVSVHHQPSHQRDRRWRDRRDLRNSLWFFWLRRPMDVAFGRSWALLKGAPAAVSAPALIEAVARGWWVAVARDLAPPWLEAQLQRLDG